MVAPGVHGGIILGDSHYFAGAETCMLQLHTMCGQAYACEELGDTATFSLIEGLFMLQYSTRMKTWRCYNYSYPPKAKCG